MNIRLNKTQLQETLREMGIEFDAEDSMNDLEKILQRENNRLWLEQAKQGKVVRSTRKSRAQNQDFRFDAKAEQKRAASTVGRSSDAKSQPTSSRGRRGLQTPIRGSQTEIGTASPPEIGERAPLVQLEPNRDIENYVVKRANGACELCEAPLNKRAEAPDKLHVYFFDANAAGESRTAKSAAALCSTCLARVRSDRLSADIKKLRRKARTKPAVKVTFSSRRKQFGRKRISGQ